jgi:putative NADH-flavin reductase
VTSIVVLGATGRTGSLLVDELLRRGHDLRLLVRRPDRLGERAERVEVVQGSSTDPAAVDKLLGGGSEAVVSALGPTDKQVTLQRDTARVLTEAMPRHGVRRFVGVSGAGIDVPGDQKGPLDKAVSFAIRTLGGSLAQDKADEYAVWAASDLDWTLVRPPRLVGGAATGGIQHDAHRPGRTQIRRADLALFLADEVEQARYVRQAPFVSAA